jgi:uncharacterized alkaline shock family protein YloU
MTDGGPDGVPAAARGGVLTDSGTNPAAPGDAPPNDPAGRGWTSITDRVVEKTAAQAALEVDHVHGISRQRISRALRSGGGVEAHAAIDGGLAQLRVEIEVDYPAPVRQITRQVRRHVRDRVTRLCGLTVTDVDITVAALRLETLQVRRVL